MSSSSGKPKTMTALDKDILREQTASGLRLANQVFSNTDKNAVMSPLSIHIAMSMLAAGAAGHVKEQIISFIGAKSHQQLHNFASIITHDIFSDNCPRLSAANAGTRSGSWDSDSSPILSAANAVWLKDSLTFKSSFKQTLETHYKAATKLLDFTKVDEAVREVNTWAEEMTNGLIKDIVDSFYYKTVLVAANALYFRASWDDPFEDQFTRDNPFFRMDGSSVDVPFMFGNDSAIGTYDTFKVLNLPYYIGGEAGRSFSMSIFLPNDIDGLPSLLQRVCTEGSSFLDRHIPKKIVDVRQLRVPKFKIEVDFKVLDVLEQLGLKIGMLTEMVEEKDEAVFVDSIVHKAFLEVNEYGIEAAACTSDQGLTCSLDYTPPVKLVDFIADHPFMFVIREDFSGLVLFVGQVLDPST